MLTGVKDIDIIILNKLNDIDIMNLYFVNKYTNNYIKQICRDDIFWLNRILTKFPELSLDILNKYVHKAAWRYWNDQRWSHYYLHLRRISCDNIGTYIFAGFQDDRSDHIIRALTLMRIKDFNYWLKEACRNGNLDVVKYLISRGADIHHSKDLACRIASQNGKLDIVKYLISIGSNIHAKDDYAFRKACQFNHMPVVKFLVENGANIHANNNEVSKLLKYNKILKKYLSSIQ